MDVRFRDREEAGKQLAALFSEYRDQEDLLVLGVPRGGVSVAYPVARALNAPLDVFVVCKLGVPGHEELAMGAIASGGVRILNSSVIASSGVREAEIAAVAAQEEHELQRREWRYRSGRPGLNLSGQRILLIDDGLATGASLRAAIVALRKRSPAQILVGVPVAAISAVESLRPEVDALRCLYMPKSFHAVGLWYKVFEQVSDTQVQSLLETADLRYRAALGPRSAGDLPVDRRTAELAQEGVRSREGTAAEKSPVSG